jgi:hypothetical protein
MPTTIYDSSLLTKRRQDKAISGSFVSRISPWNVPSSTALQPGGSNAQPTTSYGPPLGIYDQSIIPRVKVGNMIFYRKGDGGCVSINNGCPCVPLNGAQCCGTN